MPASKRFGAPTAFGLRRASYAAMKLLIPFLALVGIAAVTTLTGCSSVSTKAADVAAGIRTSLDQAGFRDVTTSQDRDKGVVVLGGHVATDNDKAQAESIARSFAGSQVVANQIEVIPFGNSADAKDAKNINSELDEGIEHNLSAALINAKVQDSVKYSVKNHVVTLTGSVNSQANRAEAQSLAASVPNVQQVVNELQVRKQKATESN